MSPSSYQNRKDKKIFFGLEPSSRDVSPPLSPEREIESTLSRDRASESERLTRAKRVEMDLSL